MFSKVKEVKLSRLDNPEKIMFVKPYQVDACLSVGWILHTDEKRYVDPIDKAPSMIMATMATVIGDKGIIWKQIYEFYKKGGIRTGNVPTWLNITWAAMTLGKLPTIHENMELGKLAMSALKLFVKNLPPIAWFFISVLVASPAIAVLSYVLVEALLYSR